VREMHSACMGKCIVSEADIPVDVWKLDIIDIGRPTWLIQHSHTCFSFNSQYARTPWVSRYQSG